MNPLIKYTIKKRRITAIWQYQSHIYSTPESRVAGYTKITLVHLKKWVCPNLIYYGVHHDLLVENRE